MQVCTAAPHLVQLQLKARAAFGELHGRRAARLLERVVPEGDEVGLVGQRHHALAVVLARRGPARASAHCLGHMQSAVACVTRGNSNKVGTCFRCLSNTLHAWVTLREQLCCAPTACCLSAPTSLCELASHQT